VRESHPWALRSILRAECRACCKSLRKCLAESDADVFNRVMLVDIEITICEKLEHVIEKAYAGRDFVLAAAFDGELQVNLSLFGDTINGGLSHLATFWRKPRSENTSRKLESRRWLCSRMPRVIRTQSLQP